MTTIVVDVPEETLAAALTEAALDGSDTTTEAVVSDALRLWAVLENPHDVLQGRDDVVCRTEPVGSDAAEVDPDAE